MVAIDDSSSGPASLRDFAIDYGGRFVIYLVDGTVLLTTFFGALLLAWLAASLSATIAGVVLAGWFLLALGYLTVAKRSRFGTLGYRLMNAKIVAVGGGQPTLLQMISRTASLLFFPLLFFVDMHHFGRTGTRQTLSDRLGGTYVVTRTMPNDLSFQRRGSIDCFWCWSIVAEE